jgi:predicted dehydrogenase
MKSAVIGFGGQGQRHFAVYEKLGVEVAAICDWEPDKIRKAVPDFPMEKVFNEVQSLLEHSGDLSIVSITTNAPTHAETAIAFSEAGVPNILCEKPIATNLLDAQRIIDVCKKNHTRLAVNHTRRYSPNHLKLRQLIREGIIGKVRHFYFNHGSIGLGNNGVHFFDSMRFYAESDPLWAIGFLDKTGTPNPRGAQFADPGAFGMILFKNGIRAFVDTFEDTGVRHIFEIVGEYGRVVIEEFGDDWRVYARSMDDRKMPLTRYVMPMPQNPFELETKFDIVELTESALRELLSGEPISCPGEDGKQALEMAIAFHVSEEQKNQKVFFPLSGTALAKDVPFA